MCALRNFSKNLVKINAIGLMELLCTHLSPHAHTHIHAHIQNQNFIYLNVAGSTNRVCAYIILVREISLKLREFLLHMNLVRNGNANDFI